MKTRLAMPSLILALVLIPGFGFGCSTGSDAQISARDYARPQKTISAARALGAESMPTAKLYLSYARDGVAQANKAIQAGNNPAAKLALARAQADANLALTMSKQQKMAMQVRDINQEIRQLDEQLKN
ncbi:DUF4398 domain-containing protein [Bradymonas sediminis]|uniref:Uncharacterized protein n=1 Tax=Bradymonas sediminis TaxID=1548548 RepID=A0A2Z4FJL0_9DELT|nr:DUF4398 domain-containing protein [Bradymonas sediminis]AWV89119.1 hypothetical protein DN745_07130 [Bradymonas sediminis]TDP64415.1 uncharacterized protein DUF4398 [Bradymonas sediminis]